MALPPKSDPRWRDFLCSANSPHFTVLATRLIVDRLRGSLRSHEATIEQAVGELHDYFHRIGFAQRDLGLIR